MSTELREKVHNRILALRSIHNIIWGDQYHLCGGLVDEKIVNDFIDKYDSEGLRRYIRRLIRSNLLPETLSDLRQKAKVLGIPYYASKKRSDLIEAINDAQRFEKTVS